MEKLHIIAGLLSNFFSASAVVFKAAFRPRASSKSLSHYPSRPFLLTYPSRAGSHLLVGDRDESLLGKFPQGVDVCPHVQFTANQHHFGIGTKLLRLSLPLWRHERAERQTSLIMPNTGKDSEELSDVTNELLRYSDNLWLLTPELREINAVLKADICQVKESKGKCKGLTCRVATIQLVAKY